MRYEGVQTSYRRLAEIRLEFKALAYLLDNRADSRLDVKELDDMTNGLGLIVRRLCTRLQRIEEALDAELTLPRESSPPAS
jgi:hypothetical protein